MFDATPPPSAPSDTGLTRLSETAVRLGTEIVDIAGFLDLVDAASRQQVTDLDGVVQASEAILTANHELEQTLDETARSAGAMIGTIKASADRTREGSERIRVVASWVERLEPRTADLDRQLRDVQSKTDSILSIAAQVNILAINAKIESARAGDAGRGFAVVAEAINALSRQTAQAAQSITASIAALSGEFASLRREATGTARESGLVREAAEETDRTFDQLLSTLEEVDRGFARIAAQSAAVHSAGEAFGPVVESMSSAHEEVSQQVSESRERAHGLIDMSETILQQSVLLGGDTDDKPFIDRVMEDSAAIGRLLEEAVARGEISARDLFSEDYAPIPGTNPAQVMAPFTRLTDRLLPPIQEGALTFDPRVVFCAAVDRNGYLPTHNTKFSQPQRDDPAWNAANARNRRIFNDRVGLKAGRNTAPFLLQVYRRDMGGGVFRMMKDLSAPIRVSGRHWGGLRLAYSL